MNLALVSRFAWPSIGGTEALVSELASSMVDAGESVRVFAHRIDEETVEWRGPLDRAPEFSPQIDPANGVATLQLRLDRYEAFLLRVAAIPGEKRRPFEALHARVSSRRFARQLAGADVVHRFGGNRMALATVRGARRLGASTIVTPLAHPGQWDADQLSARAYREADLVIATSKSDAAVYDRLGVRSDRIGICPLPTKAVVRGGGQTLRTNLNVEGPIVLFLGDRRPYKGVQELLQAAAILAPRVREARFAFVGPGPALDGAAANVLDVGPVSAPQRDAWLDAADILCVPSAAESFGLVVSEAWSAGTPVVTSDIPVLHERVTEAGGGLVSSREPPALADAIHTLLANSRLRLEMGQAGYEHWRQTCSVASVADWHRAAYARLLT